MLRDPLFLFLAAGAALYAAYAVLESRRAEPVRLAAAERAALVADFEALTGRPAAADDVARLEREYIADELLFREALGEGLHLDDGAVRERLVERMRLRITGLLPEPDEEELVNYYAENARLYEAEASMSFEQVFFTELPQDAAAVAAELRAGGEVRGDTSRYGDRFPRYGTSMLRGLFGQDFVAALWQAPLGEWSGPIRSTLGWHFVKPAERLAAARLPFDAVRDQVAADYLAAEARAAVEGRVAELERRYEVVIERP